MQTRWFVINRRYLSISVTLDGPGAENPEGLRVFCFDLSLRPILTAHCASTWSAFGACDNFVLLITSFASFSFVSDHLDTHSDFPDHASFSLLISRGVEAILRTSLPQPGEIYRSLSTLLEDIGPLSYFYASCLFLYPLLVRNAVLLLLLNIATHILYK